MSFNGEQVYMESISAVTATRGKGDPDLGAVRVEGGRHYRYVYNGDTTCADVGLAMTVLAPSSTGYTATIATVIGSPVLGVVRHASLTTGTYGWIMFKGVGSITASATVAAGDLMIIANNGLFASSLTYMGGSGPIPNSAIVTGASGGAFINYP